MASRFRLEEFDEADLASTRSVRTKPEPPPAEAPAVPREMIERARLEGYESGYQAGWDDATGTAAEEQERIGTEFARNLQDLGFTFHEARSHVMHALEPLLAGLVARVLPRLVSETMGQTIVEELLPIAARAADTPIELAVCPTSRPALEKLLAEATTLPLKLVEEPTLAEGQVYLRSGKIERHIDFTAAVEHIGAAINALYELNEKAFRNG